MFAVLKRNPVALVLAILLHLALAIFFVVGVDWQEEVKPIGADVAVVQARLVDRKQLDTKADESKKVEREKAAAAKRAEQKKRDALKKRRAEEKRKLAKIEKEREQRKADEARKKAEAEKVRLAEVSRKKEEKKKRQAELDKKQRLEQEKHKAAEEARKKAEARKRAERERKERVAREKAEAERKRKAAADAKARADRKAREAELAAEFDAEQDASEKAQVVGLIRSKVERNWLQPPGTSERGLRCTVRVRLGSSGSVLLVNVVKSSGNSAFDRSVEAAVRKADPLPMPSSQRLLAEFRDLKFEFAPSI